MGRAKVGDEDDRTIAETFEVVEAREAAIDMSLSCSKLLLYHWGLPIASSVLTSFIVLLCRMGGMLGLIFSILFFAAALVLLILMWQPKTWQNETIAGKWRLFNLRVAWILMIVFAIPVVAYWVGMPVWLNILWLVAAFMSIYYLIAWNVLKRWELEHWEALNGFELTWMLTRWWCVLFQLICVVAQTLLQLFGPATVGIVGVVGIYIVLFVVASAFMSYCGYQHRVLLQQSLNAWARLRRIASSFRGFRALDEFEAAATVFAAAQVPGSDLPFLSYLEGNDGLDVAKWYYVCGGLRKAAEIIGGGSDVVVVGICREGQEKCSDAAAFAGFCAWVYTRETFIYPVVNALLRDAEEADYAPGVRGPTKQLGEPLAAFACCLLWALRRLSEPAGVPRELWRGYRGKVEDFKEYDAMQGQKIVYPAFSSTSRTLTNALRFASPRGQWQGILLRISVPSQLTERVVCSVERFSHYAEEEYVCLPGCAFRVVGASELYPNGAAIARVLPVGVVSEVERKQLLGIVELELLEEESAWTLGPKA